MLIPTLYKKHLQLRQAIRTSLHATITGQNAGVWAESLFKFPLQKWKLLSRSDSLQPRGLYNPWNSPGQSTGVGSLSLLQGTFRTRGLNPGLPHCGWILYQLSYKGSPRILEWVIYPFSSGSSRPRNQTISCIAGGFFTNWAITKTWYKIFC